MVVGLLGGPLGALLGWGAGALIGPGRGRGVEEAAEGAAKDGWRIMRERRRAELVGKMEERVAHLRQRLQAS